jgi:hypothetical protein
MHPDPASLGPTLKRGEALWVLIVAIAQAAALYAFDWGIRSGAWGLDQLGPRIYWAALVCTIPSLAMLTAPCLRQRGYALALALATAVVAWMATWAQWSASGAQGLDASAVLLPFAFLLGGACFVALPFLQCRLASGRWRPDYPLLFEHAWHNGLSLVLLTPFVWLCWGVLWLWGALFRLVHVDFFAELFAERWFIYLASGVMAGGGLLIAHGQRGALQVLRQVMFAVFRTLLPLVAFFAVLFLLFLPFTGMDLLWQTRKATPIVVSLVYTVVLFTNAVFQDGRPGPEGRRLPVPRPVWWLIQAGLLSMPFYAGIALYALWLRVDQYGWTAGRWLAFLFVLLVSGHALGYAWAAVRPRQGLPMAAMPRVNVTLAWLALGLIAAMCSPLADPFRIAVASQSSRLASGRVQAAQLDLPYLRFQAGRRGAMALQRWVDEGRLAGDEGLQQRALALLAASGPTVQPPEAEASLELAQVLSVGNYAAPDAAWFAALDAGWRRRCAQAQERCLVFGKDLDRDGVPEYLICESWGARGAQLRCQVTRRGTAGWHGVATFSAFDVGDEQIAAVRRGEIQAVPHRWDDLLLGGRRIVIDDASSRDD